MTEFGEMKRQFIELCKKYGVMTPQISKARGYDSCDVTDPPFVRIYLQQECDREYQVRHLFGHYLADLHAYKKGKYSDKVADVIASMVRECD
jgi:hypothetical protein